MNYKLLSILTLLFFSSSILAMYNQKQTQEVLSFSTYVEDESSSGLSSSDEEETPSKKLLVKEQNNHRV